MATRKQATKQPLGSARWQVSASSDDSAERIAFDILAARQDLLPSVERIMTAQLGTAATLRAICLFRDALTTPGDVHRDPRVAIANSAPATEDAGTPGPTVGRTQQ